MKQKTVNVTSHNEALQALLFVSCFVDHLDVMQVLLSHKGADSMRADNFGATPLFVAAAEGYESTVQLLLDRLGVNIEATNDDHRYTTLWLALSKGHENAARTLVQHRAESSSPIVDSSHSQ